MEQYIIKGGNPLVGEVEIGGAKKTGSGVYNGSEKGAWGVCFGEAADAGYWASVRWRWGPGS